MFLWTLTVRPSASSRVKSDQVAWLYRLDICLVVVPVDRSGVESSHGIFGQSVRHFEAGCIILCGSSSEEVVA